MAVLLHVYSKCVDGQDEFAKRRIEAALGHGEFIGPVSAPDPSVTRRRRSEEHSGVTPESAARAT